MRKPQHRSREVLRIGHCCDGPTLRYVGLHVKKGPKLPNAPFAARLLAVVDAARVAAPRRLLEPLSAWRIVRRRIKMDRTDKGLYYRTTAAPRGRHMCNCDSPPILKSSRRYLLWRLYVIIGLPAFWASCVASLFIEGWASGVIEMGGIVVGAPAIFMLMNWFAFPWPYSIFGPYQRHPKPAQPPRSLIWSWGVIGNAGPSPPGVKWSFFPDGVGIDATLLGNAYLPADCITFIEKRWLGQYAVHHNCVELRSPVVIPRATCQAMFLSLDDKHRQRLMTI
jgi:hypothetical protein